MKHHYQYFDGMIIKEGDEIQDHGVWRKAPDAIIGEIFRSQYHGHLMHRRLVAISTNPIKEYHSDE